MMPPLMPSTTCLLFLLLLLAGSVATELAHSDTSPSCVPASKVLDQGFRVDHTICPVSDDEINIMEEASADSAEGKLLLAVAHFSRHVDQDFFQRVEEALSAQSLAPAHTMLAVHLMAFSHHYLIDSRDSAREWYQLCLDLDENHKQCLIEASRLLTYEGEGGEDSTAWFLARKALSVHLADVSPFELPCSVVIQGARSALNECWNGLEGVCTLPKIFLALNLIDIAETICDKDSTLQHIFEAETIVSVLKNSMANLYGDESPPDLRGNCISAPPTTDDEIVETNLLAFFHHNSHRCVTDFPEEVSFGENITIGNETTGDVDLDAAAAVGRPVVPEQVEEEPGRLRILDHESPHEDDIDTPHSSLVEIQLLFLLETHRLTGWW